jgi:tetratricopeptide (TPR) repeat protein
MSSIFLKNNVRFIWMSFVLIHRHALFSIVTALFISFSFVTNFAQDSDKDPVKLYNLAQDAHEKGDFKTAIKIYDEAISIYPEFPEAEYQKGNALVSLGRDAEAEKAFRRALELRENWNLPTLKLGELLVRTNHFAEAETILVKVIQANQNEPSAYIALTELRLKTKASPEILKDLLGKLQTFSNDSKATAAIWSARGSVEHALGDKVSAKTSFNRAISLNPNDVNALSGVTEIALAENNFQLALENAQKIVKLSPNSISAKILLARVYAADGKTSEALAILETLDGNNPDVLSLRNLITAKSTNDVGILEKQLETDAKNPLLLGRLCILTRTTPAKALEYCRRASETDPKNISPAIGFGAALVQAKQFANAAQLLRKLLQIEPENYAIHANLAAALFALKDYAGAKIEYDWIIKNNPNLAITYYFLAIAHDNLAEYTQALKNYQKFLQIADPKQNQLEIDKVNLRLPILERQIKQGKGKK